MIGSITAISIPVPEAMFLQSFRRRHLSASAASMPPHISLFGPFKDMESVDENDLHILKGITASFPRFPFILQKTGNFPDIHVLYLQPEPVTPFMALHRALCAGFPEVPPGFPDPVIHLTLAGSQRGELEKVEQEFQAAFGKRLPIEATAKEICIYEKRDDIWTQRISLPLD